MERLGNLNVRLSDVRMLVQPPQREGRLPQYSRNQLLELQQKCDDLEAMGLLRKPEDIDISV